MRTGRPVNPDTIYRVGIHRNGGHVYATTQPFTIGEDGRKHYRHRHWGTVDESAGMKFSLGTEYLLASPEDPGAFLISDFLKDIFEKAGLTGWKTYDITIHRKNGDILPGFYGFSITGRNPSSNIGNTPEIPDFFMLHPDKLWLICTQRVVDVLKENKIKDFETTLLSNESYPDVYQQINFPK